MNLVLSVAAWPLIALTLAPPPAKEWRGITPLRSTRADVERLLGPPESESGSVYVTEGERVSVTYSRRPCDYGWRVPPDTVVSFFVHPKRPPKLSDLKLDEKKYERRRSYHVETIHYYIDLEAGINYTVESPGELVTGVEYYPSLGDEAPRCQPAPAKTAAAAAPPSPPAAPKPAAGRDVDGRGRRRKRPRRP
jgi:hypothetical protein